MTPFTIAPWVGAVTATAGGAVSLETLKAIRRNGRLFGSGFSMLAKNRYRSAAFDASALRISPKFVAGLSSHSCTIPVIVQALKPATLSMAFVSYAAELSACASGTLL